MARISLTYRCGHLGESQAPKRDGTYLKRRAAEKDCWECLRDQENAQAALDAKTAGLPALIGVSERQRAYGETCRARVLTRLTNLLHADEMMNDRTMPVVATDEAAALRGVVQYASRQADAAFWCDAADVGSEDRYMVDFVLVHMGLAKPRYGGALPLFDDYLKRAAAHAVESNHSANEPEKT